MKIETKTVKHNTLEVQRNAFDQTKMVKPITLKVQHNVFDETKTVKSNTLEVQYKNTFDQKINGTQIKTTCNQKFPQRKPTEPLPFEDKLRRRQQIFTVKPDHIDSQHKDINIRSNSPAMVLNIPVMDDKESKEKHEQVGGCKRLENLMDNLNISDRELKTQAVHKKENDFSEKAESLNDSFLKLNISGDKSKRQGQKSKKQKDEEGELIERGPVASPIKLQSRVVHPYSQQTSVLALSRRLSLHSGGRVAEQPCISSNNVPLTVEEFSINSSRNVSTNIKEDVVNSEISTDIWNEDFLSFFGDWASKEYEQCDHSNTTDISLPDIHVQNFEPILENTSPYDCGDSPYGNTSPHCSRDSTYENTSPHCSSDSTCGNISPYCSMDSTYGTLSPDSNVISPMSYISSVSSPNYTGSEFTNETPLNEAVTSNSSSDSNLLPSEPIMPLDLYELIDKYLEERSGSDAQQNRQYNDFVEHNIINQVHQNCQFDVGVSQTNSAAPQHVQVMNNNKLTTEIFNIPISTMPQDLQVVNVNQELLSKSPSSDSVVPPHIQENINNKLYTGMTLSSTMPTPHTNTTNIGQIWNVVYSVNESDNLSVPNVVTTTPPKHFLTNISLADCVQPNVMNNQNVCVPTPSKQTSPSSSVVNTAPQLIYGCNIVPNIGTGILNASNKPDNSAVSFIYGDSAKNNISKSIPDTSTGKFNTPTNSVRPVARQILPAGPEVYETGMSIPAVNRLEKLMKNNGFTVQYVKVCHDLSTKPDLLKERLFQLLSKTPKAQNWLTSICAHIALIVTPDMRKANLLMARNSEGYSPLYLASVNHPDQPLVARYIADSLLDQNISPDEIFDSNGNSILHLLASLGDSHVAVLAELLNVRHPKTAKPVCNVNRPNTSQMETPLHVAVAKHSLPHVNCLATVKLLISHGANVAAQNKKEMTPLHYAVRGICEPKILTFLLQSPTSHSALDVTDSEHNTALHLAAANNNISVSKQKGIIWSLIGHGANYRIQNMDRKVALALVDIERRQEIKKLFLRRQTL